MSSTSASAEKGPAPWKSTFLSHLSKLDSPEFVLSTVQKAPEGSAVPYLPRARYCIFRGFWAELPENKHNPAPMNERVYESDLPTFTTDIRMLKVPQIFGSSPGHASSEEQWQGSGGGGPVEAVYWVQPAMTQWRIKGDALIIGPDIEGGGEESSGVRTVKSEVGKRMRVVKPGSEADWSWAKEVTGHFGNTSPALRGTSFSRLMVSSFAPHFRRIRSDCGSHWTSLGQEMLARQILLGGTPGLESRHARRLGAFQNTQLPRFLYEQRDASMPHTGDACVTMLAVLHDLWLTALAFPR